MNLDLGHRNSAEEFSRREECRSDEKEERLAYRLKVSSLERKMMHSLKKLFRIILKFQIQFIYKNHENTKLHRFLYLSIEFYT
jgi:hypothetical protein